MVKNLEQRIAHRVSLLFISNRYFLCSRALGGGSQDNARKDKADSILLSVSAFAKFAAAQLGCKEWARVPFALALLKIFILNLNSLLV